MLTDQEIRNKLFFKNLSAFIIEDPLNGAEPLYDDTGHDVIIGHIDNPPELVKTNPDKKINVPLYEFKSRKQYTDMFVSTIKKAVEITGNVHECDDFKVNFASKLMIEKGGYCAGILGSITDEKTMKIWNQLNEERAYARMPLQKGIDIEPGMIYCFPHPDYVGVCPERYNYDKELKKVVGPIKLGLMLIASSVHAIKLV